MIPGYETTWFEGPELKEDGSPKAVRTKGLVPSEVASTPRRQATADMIKRALLSEGFKIGQSEQQPHTLTVTAPGKRDITVIISIKREGSQYHRRDSNTLQIKVSLSRMYGRYDYHKDYTYTEGRKGFDLMKVVARVFKDWDTARDKAASENAEERYQDLQETLERGMDRSLGVLTRMGFKRGDISLKSTAPRQAGMAPTHVLELSDLSCEEVLEIFKALPRLFEGRRPSYEATLTKVREDDVWEFEVKMPFSGGDTMTLEILDTHLRGPHSECGVGSAVTIVPHGATEWVADFTPQEPTS